jgi:hypothetical protein
VQPAEVWESFDIGLEKGVSRSLVIPIVCTKATPRCSVTFYIEFLGQFVVLELCSSFRRTLNAILLISRGENPQSLPGTAKT